MKSNSTSGQYAEYIPRYIRTPDTSEANFDAQNNEKIHKRYNFHKV